MPSFEQMEQDFEALDRGTPRLNAMRDAIREADLQKHVRWQFWFRYDYVEESIFCGDRYYAMIMFPELLQHYDDHPELQEDRRCAHSMLLCIRWMVEAAPEFPQVSKEEIENYFRLLKRRLQEQECSLSAYYMKRGLFYMHVDPAVEAKCFYRFLEEPQDDSSDGPALCKNHEVLHYLYAGDEERALKAAQRIFDGKLRSHCLPQSTYDDFMTYYTRTGQIGKAAEYTALTLPRVTGNPYYLDIQGTMLTVYSHADPEAGAKLFSKNYPLLLASKNPWLRAHFLRGAAHLFRRFEEDGRFPEALHVPKDSPVYTAVQEGNTKFAAEQMYAIAAEIAGKFDKRNGTGDYTDALQNRTGVF